MRVARWSILAVGAAGAALGWALSGPAAAVSVVLGVALVAAFLATGAVPVLVADAVPVRAGAGVGLLLLTYTLRLALALAVIRVAARAELLEPRWFGMSVLVGAAAWVGGLFAGWVRADRTSTIGAP
jgi:hypothetical protein